VQTLTESYKEELWSRWQDDRDPQAREELICHYLPLVNIEVAKVARSIPPSSRPDLSSFGVIGLMDAIDKFKPELGYRFETYCPFRIRGAIRDGIRVLAWLPRRAAQRKSKIIEQIVPFDFQGAWEHTNGALETWHQDPLQATAFDGLELEADHEAVAKAIECLPDKERKVIVDYYYGSRRLAEIGHELGVTESRACQVHRRALDMLRQLLVEPLTA
jgi:RNA polymerase sigma factor FliA